jgi:5-methylthioadenosine/S-adenosylhomocysteine deaminase
MSGNTLDIIGQLGYVAKVHKLDRKNRNVMPAIDVVEMATIGGARALHMEDRIGSLEAGKLADLVVIDTDRPAMVPLYDVYSALVYAATPGDVRTTVVHGKVVVDERRVVSVDGAAVRAKMREIGRRVTARVAQGLGSAGGQD